MAIHLENQGKIASLRELIANGFDPRGTLQRKLDELQSKPEYVYIVRCIDGSYSVVARPDMIEEASKRSSDLHTLADAQAFAEKIYLCKLADDYDYDATLAARGFEMPDARAFRMVR